MSENIVHLVLAKLPDAPAGTKGISLFIVPKFLPAGDGAVGERNAVSCGSIEHKMGIKASATCVINFDGATGYLIGEANKGLNCMFTMMNHARLGTGMQGLCLGEASYQGALKYANERLQMRALTGPKAPDKPADPIIVHPDVRRMLLTMKAFNEGNRALAYFTAQLLDVAHPDLQGLHDRHRSGGDQPRHADLRRPWLYPRVGHGAAGPRLPHRADLRRHQWHPGPRPARAQGAWQPGQAAARLHQDRPPVLRGPGRTPAAQGLRGAVGEPEPAVGRADPEDRPGGAEESRRGRRRVGGLPDVFRLHHPRLLLAAHGRGCPGQARRGRRRGGLLPGQAGHLRVLLQAPVAAYRRPPGCGRGRQRVHDEPAGRAFRRLTSVEPGKNPPAGGFLPSVSWQSI